MGKLRVNGSKDRDSQPGIALFTYDWVLILASSFAISSCLALEFYWTKKGSYLPSLGLNLNSIKLSFLSWIIPVLFSLNYCPSFPFKYTIGK